MIDLDDLRKKAEAATPGPWEAVHGDEVSCVCEPTAELTWDDHGGEVFRPEDAAHIAAFDPPTVLALIDRCEAAEAAVARVRALHHRWVRRDGPVVCAWCDANGSGDAEWPCRTIRALDGEDA